MRFVFTCLLVTSGCLALDLGDIPECSHTVRFDVPLGTGLGMRMRKVDLDDELIVSNVQRKRAAELEGVKVGDEIIAIDGKNCAGLAIEQITELLVGTRRKNQGQVSVTFRADCATPTEPVPPGGSAFNDPSEDASKAEENTDQGHKTIIGDLENRHSELKQGLGDPLAGKGGEHDSAVPHTRFEEPDVQKQDLDDSFHAEPGLQVGLNLEGDVNNGELTDVAQDAHLPVDAAPEWLQALTCRKVLVPDSVDLSQFVVIAEKCSTQSLGLKVSLVDHRVLVKSLSSGNWNDSPVRPGDQLLKLNGRFVASLDDLRSALEENTTVVHVVFGTTLPARPSSTSNVVYFTEQSPKEEPLALSENGEVIKRGDSVPLVEGSYVVSLGGSPTRYAVFQGHAHYEWPRISLGEDCSEADTARQNVADTSQDAPKSEHDRKSAPLSETQPIEQQQLQSSDFDSEDDSQVPKEKSEPIEERNLAAQGDAVGGTGHDVSAELNDAVHEDQNEQIDLPEVPRKEEGAEYGGVDVEEDLNEGSRGKEILEGVAQSQDQILHQGQQEVNTLEALRTLEVEEHGKEHDEETGDKVIGDDDSDKDEEEEIAARDDDEGGQASSKVKASPGLNEDELCQTDLSTKVNDRLVAETGTFKASHASQVRVALSNATFTVLAKKCHSASLGLRSALREGYAEVKQVTDEKWEISGGVKAGDRLVKVNGIRIFSSETLKTAIEISETLVSLEFSRDLQSVELDRETVEFFVDVTFESGELPQTSLAEYLELEAEEPGSFVIGKKQSAGKMKQVTAPGDLLLEINGVEPTEVLLQLALAEFIKEFGSVSRLRFKRGQSRSSQRAIDFGDCDLPSPSMDNIDSAKKLLDSLYEDEHLLDRLGKSINEAT